MKGAASSSSSSSSSPMTFRAFALGSFFAMVNSSINMYGNFRSAGGLQQYWAIVVGYFVLKFLDKAFPLGSLLHPSDVTPQEHTISTIIATAAAFSQSLGLSGGIAPLQMYLGDYFKYAKISFLVPYTLVAAFFGVFTGLIFHRSLVIRNSNNLPFPIAALNVATLSAFHPASSSTKGSDAKALDHDDDPIEAEKDQFRMSEEEAERRKTVKLFFIFFGVVLLWSFLINSWFQFLTWFPILCWVCKSNTCQVLGEGLLGVGLPGFSLDVSTTFGYFVTILPRGVIVQMISGAILVGWFLAPSLYYANVTVWPSGLRLYTTNSSILSSDNITMYPDGGVYTHKMAAEGERIGLSSAMFANGWLIICVCFGSVYDAAVSCIPGLGDRDGSDASAEPDQKKEPLLVDDDFYDEEGETILSGEENNKSMVRNLEQEYFETDMVPTWVGPAGFALLTVSIVIIARVFDLEMVWYEIIIVCACSLFVSYGLGIIVALTGQNMAFPSAMLAQFVLGITNPHQDATNIVGAALSSSVAAQALLLFQDMRFACLMGVKPKEMAMAQGFGTLVGALCSAVVYYTVMHLAYGCCPQPTPPYDTWCPSGCSIKMGGDLYANIGAQSSFTFSQVFSTYGLPRIFSDNPVFEQYCTALLIITLVMVPARRALPVRFKAYCPDLIVMGVGAAAPATVWYIGGVVLLYYVYRVKIARDHPEWFRKYNFISTSACVMGGGIALICVLIGTSIGFGDAFKDGISIGGGKYGDGCEFHPEIMPQF